MTIIKIKDIPITSRSGRIYPNNSNVNISNSSTVSGGGVDLNGYGYVYQSGDTTTYLNESYLKITGTSQNIYSNLLVSGDLTANNLYSPYLNINENDNGNSKYIGLNISNLTAATSSIPSQYSPVLSFTGNAWNGSLSKKNSIDIHLKPISNSLTYSELIVSNGLKNGVSDSTTLLSISSNGVVSGNTLSFNTLNLTNNAIISGSVTINNGLNVKNIQSATEQYLLMYSPTDGRVTYSNYGLSGVTILTGVTSGYNTSLGYNNAQNNGGNYNTYVGAYIQYNATNSNYNTIIGYTAGYGNTGNYNVFIGYDAGRATSSLSNKLYIENSSSNSPLIYGEFDNDFVKINGSLQVTGQLTLNSGLTITTSSLSFDNTNKHSSFGTAYLYGKKFGKFNYLTGYVYITSNFSTPAKQLSKINNYVSPGNIVYFTLSNYQTYQNANGYVDTSGNIFLQWGIASNEYYYLNAFWIE